MKGFTRSMALGALLSLLTLREPTAYAGPAGCGSVGLVNRTLAYATGKPSWRTKLAKAEARTHPTILAGGPEVKRAYENAINRVLEVENAGLVEFEQSVGKMLELASSARITDQQRGIVYLAMEFFGDLDGAIRPVATLGSTSWLSKAGAGNRGEIIELVLAMNASMHGATLSDGSVFVVGYSSIAALGKRVFTSAGGVVEGDLVESLGGGLERFIDFKGIDASFDLAQLERVGQGVREGRVGDFLFIAEEGVTFPGSWMARLNEINVDLKARGLSPIRIGSVAGF